MTRKLPTDAFEFYFGQGVSRSYLAVAKHYGVTKKAVVALAKREQWQEKLASRDRQVQEGVEKKVIESLEAMQERHLRILRAIQSKALETLRSVPLDTAYQAVRALGMAIEQERVARGEPGQRSTVDIEAIIKREYKALVLPQDGQEDWGDAQRA